MIKGSLARRYARALMAIGKDSGKYEEIGSELSEFSNLVYSDKQLKGVLTGPQFHHDIKEKIVIDLCSKLGLSDVVRHFVCLLNDKRRLDSLSAIADAYAAMADEVSGRLRAQVTSAKPLSADEEQKVQGALEKVTGKQVIMTVDTDSTIIGGLVTQIGGKLYDGSIRTQLKKIQESLAQAG